MITFDPKNISLQSVIAYASIVMGVLTSQLSAIHLPTVASAILGIFGVLLHPQTSVTSSAPSVKATDTATDTPTATATERVNV